MLYFGDENNFGNSEESPMEHTSVVDYRELNLHTLNEPRYSHLKLLLFWPSFGIVFFILERVWIRDSYHMMFCPLDNHIPFCEWFVIPYFSGLCLSLGCISTRYYMTSPPSESSSAIWPSPIGPRWRSIFFSQTARNSAR